MECRETAGGWSCTVRVGAPDDSTEHEVDVSSAELESLSPGAPDPVLLVEASFRFLLEHEPRESILAHFAIRTIASYFPSYPAEIRSRL